MQDVRILNSTLYLLVGDFFYHNGSFNLSPKSDIPSLLDYVGAS